MLNIKVKNTMLKQPCAKAIFDLLKIDWAGGKHISNGGTVTREALRKIYDRLDELQRNGKLTV